jgi:hypothetical protein
MVAPNTTKDSTKDKSQAEMPTLHSLPYDLLLNIVQFLVDLRDVHALQLVSSGRFKVFNGGKWRSGYVQEGWGSRLFFRKAFEALATMCDRAQP